jgi:hypothetical protein
MLVPKAQCCDTLDSLQGACEGAASLLMRGQLQGWQGAGLAQERSVAPSGWGLGRGRKSIESAVNREQNTRAACQWRGRVLFPAGRGGGCVGKQAGQGRPILPACGTALRRGHPAGRRTGAQRPQPCRSQWPGKTRGTCMWPCARVSRCCRKLCSATLLQGGNHFNKILRVKAHLLVSFLNGGRALAWVAAVCIRYRFLMMASSSADALTAMMKDWLRRGQ